MLNVFRAALGTALLSATLPAMAITVVVNTSGLGQQADCESGDPAGACSLRGAIQATNAAGAIPAENPPFHIIEFDVDGEISLASDLDPVTAPVQINQPDGTNVAIACSSTLFTPVEGLVVPTSASSGSYALYNLSMDGCASTAGGGSIRFLQADSDLTMDAVSITNSEALNASSGGAILLGAGTVSALSNLTISDAIAGGDGGAIANRGSLTLTDSTISGSAASGSGGGVASVITQADGSLNIERVLFDSNSADVNGGGLYVTATITGVAQALADSRLTNNSTTNGNGAGVAVTEGVLQIVGTTFDANAAASTGGAVFLDQSDAEVDIENATFSGNTAPTGGAIGASADVATGSSVTFSTFMGNSADIGGAIFGTETGISMAFPGNVEDPFYKNVFAANVTPDAAVNDTCAFALNHSSSQGSGSNIADDTSCGFTQASDLQGEATAFVSPVLSNNNPENAFGGLELPTHRLIAGGAAIDLGSAAFNNGADQRGGLTADGDENGTAVRDPGAYEFAGYSAVELTMATLSIAENASAPLVATVRRYGNLANGAQILLATAPGTATAGADYTTPSETEGSLAFATGEASSASDLEIEILDDELVEDASETFTVAIDRSDAITSPEVDLGVLASSTANILDFEEGIFSLSVPATATEGSLVATINRTGGTDGEVTVQLSTSATGTTPATAMDDFPLLTDEPIVFGDGDTSMTYELDIDDDDYEPEDETFTITIAIAGDAGSKPTVDPDNNSTEVTITSDDSAKVGSFQFQISDASRMVAEDAGSITLSVTRMDGTDCGADVVYESVDDTATSGSDYTVPAASADRTLSFSDGSDAPLSFDVTILNDDLGESDEQFSISLVSVTPTDCEAGAEGSLGAPNPSVITITSDELAQFQFSQASRTVAENAGEVVVSVEPVDTVSGSAVRINYATQDGSGANAATAGSDYTDTTGTLTWNDGESDARSFSIPILSDTGPAEANEMFVVMIAVEAGDKGEIVGTNPIPVTIVEQQGVRLAGEAFVSAAENGNAVEVTVERLGNLDGAASVNVVATADGTATVDDDFTAATQTVSWSNGEGGAKIAMFPITDDNLVEADETFSVSLANPNGVELAAPTNATATITDDDSTVTMTMATASIGEAGGSVEITAERVGAVFLPISVDIATLAGSASSPEDFMALPAGTTLTWDAGSAGPRSVNVSIVDNGTPDSERVFTASIAPSAGEGNVAIGDPAQTVVSIADDDAEIRFAETEVMVSEDDGSATLTVERFTTGTGAVSVNYSVTGGTATSGSDYVVANGTLNWPDGDSTDRSITISITDDIVAEAQETIVVTLSDPTTTGDPAPLGSDSSATVRINDNEQAGLILTETGGSTAVTEGGAADTISVALTSRPSANVTVSFDAPARLSVRTANPTDDSQLVFTPANWNTNQTVEVLASINGTEEGTVTQTLTARSSSSDASFDNLSDSISVVISDPTERSGGGGSGALGGGLLIVLGGLAALRRRRLTH